ncbi:MAG: hypothetical protein CL477_13270 [Acidobacteria bacterium]|jgi:hypothetical protein|nr:hypothetical protein [Acidobacteriota bacterium]MDP7338281.1 DUF1552 domain-containing protein [Vicinamibacterales bacterium]HJN42605.1 DUF1552 domain-containing protein [Vicinamibacterales bacterium]
MIITKMALPRRTFLRGVGATLALPLLDGMVPALSALSGPPSTAASPVSRLFVGYVPNGVIMDKWTPTAEGGSFELPATLRPLEPFKDQLTVVSGLASAPMFPLPGEGTGDHVRAASAFLTGVHPKKTEGPDIRGGTSIDQIAAQSIGQETQLTSLELSLDPNELIGACEAGWSCAYANTLSWRNPTTPLPMENQPRAVFERLFGDADDTSQAARLARIREDRSILDSLVHEVDSFRSTLAPSDRDKITQYLDAIRDIERRIQLAEAQSDIELPELARPTGGIPDTFADHARLMFDLQVLALQTDMTRVITFMMSREVSPRTYPELGIPDPHHGLSHHQNNPAQMEKLSKVNLHHIQQFAYFLEQLRATPVGDGTLLDSMLMLYGCGISDGNQHLHVNLPILLAGGAGGRLRGGRHLRVADETPLTNLQLTLLDRIGVPTEQLGDSTGQLTQLSDV